MFSVSALNPGKTQVWDGCSTLVLFFFVFSLGHGWSSSTSGYGKDAQAVSSAGWGFREHFELSVWNSWNKLSWAHCTKLQSFLSEFSKSFWALLS